MERVRVPEVTVGSEPALRVCLAMYPWPPDFAGHAVQFRQCFPFFAERGVSITVLTRRPMIDAPWPEEGVPIHRDLRPGDGVWPNVVRTLQFRRHLRENAHRYDVVHSTPASWDFVLNLPYLERLGIASVAEMVQLGGDDPVRISRSPLGHRKLALLRRVDAWVGISWVFLPTLRAVGIPDSEFHRIYCGVDLERYRPRTAEERRALRAKLDVPEDARLVVSVGSVIPRKGMDRVLDAWRQTSPVVGRDLLVVLGPDRVENGLLPEFVEHAAGLRRAAEAPNLAGTVRFMGQVEEVEEYMGASDVFLFLSRREGLGNVILEALASGLPCIVSPLDGIGADLVAEGETGLVAEHPDDAGDVARKLRALLEDEPLREKMGRAGVRAARERFSMETRVDALTALWRELVARRRARTPRP